MSTASFQSGDDWIDWAEWWRVPRELPEVDQPPAVRPGERHLVHHVDQRTVARYEPARGTAEPGWRFAERVFRADARVDGRYLPLRSGVLAYYCDEAGRVVVQHRRRRVVVSSGMRCSQQFIWAARRLRFHDGSGREVAQIRLIDAPGRWQGPWVRRRFEIAMFFFEDHDLITAIVKDLTADTPRLV